MAYNAVEKYMRDVKCRLVCKKATKAMLLEGISEEIYTFVDGAPEVNYPQLVEAFGRPSEMAGLLQENVKQQEYEQTVKRRKILVIALSVLAVLIIAGLVGYVVVLSRQTELHVTETIIYWS